MCRTGLVAVVLDAALFIVLFGDTVHAGPAATWITLVVVLVVSFVAESVYRKKTGRRFVLTGQSRPEASAGP